MSNSEDSSYKKRKVEASPESYLPSDMALSYVARVSRTDHAALSLVSKSYRALVASSDLYKIRSIIGQTETYVYDKEASSVVVLDWGIYVIGGFIKDNRTSDVFLLDCRTHTWRQVTSMRVARANTAAGVIDRKIYVLGGCKFDGDQSSRFGEVFDPKTQTWDAFPWIPGLKVNDQYFKDSFVCDQKVYGLDTIDRTLYYKPRKGRWGRGNHRTLYYKPRKGRWGRGNHCE